MVLDLEKNAVHVETNSNSSTSEKEGVAAAPPIPVPSKLRALNEKIEGLAGLEARGISRVLPEERHGLSPLKYAQIAMLWYSANISANNLAVGLLGPMLFNLGFVDSAMMAVWGCLVGSAFTAYMSIWGAQSGNRTQVSKTFQPPLGACRGRCVAERMSSRSLQDSSWDIGRRS